MLGIAGAKPVERLMRRLGFRIGVGRFVAGEGLEDAVRVVRELEDAGHRAILDLLGEFVDTPEGVEDMVNQILITLDRLGTEEFERHMSMKPTQLGLGISQALADGNARAIAERAQKVGAHVCLDMENHPYVDGTLELYHSLRSRGLTNVSTVLQSYLHRTPDDLRSLGNGATVRLVKGAYNEPSSVAIQDRSRIEEALIGLIEQAFGMDMHVNIATHDEKLLARSAEIISANGVDRGRYEFQLLYGIKPRLQARLLEDGHVVRIYVPYGHDWYGYYSRRLAERPANLGLVVRGLFG